MGKHEPMTAKAISIRMRRNGLQKIKYYCEMCKKQCPDDNGFKCHIMSEAHQRQALIVSENPEKFVSEFSKQFMDGFMYILKTRYKTKRVLANTIFQEYIKERDHIHMNGTRWTSLTEFANWLGKNGIVKVDDSERGVMVTYIDNDPETLRRQELDAKRAQQAKEAAEREQKEIERQREAAREVYEKLDKKKRLEAEPIPIVRVNKAETDDVDTINQNATLSSEPEVAKNPPETEVVERPLFKVQTFSLKSAATSTYKPPPPKRKLNKKDLAKKKSKVS